MHRLNIVDPRELFALPDAVVRRHLAHVSNHLDGRYEGVRTQAPRNQGSVSEVLRGFRESRKELPTPDDVRAAQAILRGGAEGSLAEAARATLRRAQVEA